MSAIKNTNQVAPFWPEHVSKWRDSGLSQADYCRQYGLCQNSFSYHTLKSSTGLMSNKSESAGFVRVQVIPQPQYHEPLTLHFANGARLTGIAENNMEMIKQRAVAVS
ncbi:MAG: hypothetical protein ACI9J4_001188 [Paraglaciecola sp.]